MLTEEERAEIDTEAAQYPTRKAASVDALKVVQRHRGWVSDESLMDIAHYLGMSAHELEGVATFYNLVFRKPVGKHIALVCNSVSCWVMGSQKLGERLAQRLNIAFGQTTADGNFTLLPIVCLGACEAAPAMMVDEDLHGPVAPDQIDEVLARYVSRGGR